MEKNHKVRNNPSLGKNAVLNGIKTLLQTLFPLITFPYVCRVLSVTGIGKYNFSTSVMQYFLLIAALGVATYAVREGAKYRDSKEEFEQFAGEVFTINMAATAFSYLCFFVLLFAVPKFHDYKEILLVLSIEIIFATIGVEWIYTIYEEYTYITIRSILIKVISIFLLFLLVRKAGDYVIYAGITVFVVGGSNLINFIHVRKLCRLRLVRKVNWKKHLVPILIIFASSVATIIYVNSDMTMLGFMTSDYETGIYAVSTKIYKIVKQLLAAVLVVAVPRLSMLMGKNKMEEYREVASDIFSVISLILFPAVLGLMIFSKEVVLIISKEAFLPAVPSMVLLCIALIFCIYEWFYTQCVLLPAKQEKIILYATMISAALNIILNFFMIPVWKVEAAAFSTIVSELVMTIICAIYARKVVKLKGEVLRNFISIIAGCAIIAGICFAVKRLPVSSWMTILIGIVLSVIGYLVVLVICQNYIIMRFLFGLKWYNRRNG